MVTQIATIMVVFDSENRLCAQIVELVLWVFFGHLAKHVINSHADILKLR